MKHKIENKKYDTIVIGGGIAGLSSAAYLAKAGKKVAVFEQHNIPGGYYTSFTRNGVIFDISAVGMLAFIGFTLKGRAYAPHGGAQKIGGAFEEACS